MKSDQNKTGLTLIEMLIVVAIVVILTTMVIGLAGRIDDQSKEQLTKNTIGIITAALGQFNDYEYRYVDPIYAEFDFPLDCTFMNNAGIENAVANALGLAPGSVLISGGTLNITFSAGEAMYFFLSQVPGCSKTLDRIDESLITNLGDDKQPRIITITYPGGSTKEYPLFRIIDPWGTTLRYKYYDNMTLDPRSKLTFPVIISAGPDKKFGNTDDISSRK
ncbi:MAG: type II secretion system protein [Planctomycetota bacterium]|jgi:prepilin-type N-terminal cleavage/methylation domain-containing protein